MSLKLTLMDSQGNETQGILKAVGVDQWGHADGGEATDHGDFLTPVTQALTAINAALKAL